MTKEPSVTYVYPVGRESSEPFPSVSDALYGAAKKVGPLLAKVHDEAGHLVAILARREDGKMGIAYPCGVVRTSLVLREGGFL